MRVKILRLKDIHLRVNQRLNEKVGKKLLSRVMREYVRVTVDDAIKNPLGTPFFPRIGKIRIKRKETVMGDEIWRNVRLKVYNVRSGRRFYVRPGTPIKKQIAEGIGTRENLYLYSSRVRPLRRGKKEEDYVSKPQAIPTETAIVPTVRLFEQDHVPVQDMQVFYAIKGDVKDDAAWDYSNMPKEILEG